jgi:hypothetical protein
LLARPGLGSGQSASNHQRAGHEMLQKFHDV